jgi:hypothetical protein
VPRADTTWAEGKGGYKALQYMACGVATVAAGRAVVVPGVTALLARVGESWAASPLHWR